MNKRHIRLLEATRKCGLDSHDHLRAYSWLVYQKQHKTPVRPKDLAANLHVRLAKAQKLLARLLEQGLASQTDTGAYFAIQPPPGWFVTVSNGIKPDWFRNFARYESYMLVKGRGNLRPVENAVLWLLKNWNEADMIVYPGGLATQLCCSRSAVAQALKALRRKDIIDDGLQVANDLESRYGHYWADPVPQSKKHFAPAKQSRLVEVFDNWFDQGSLIRHCDPDSFRVRVLSAERAMNVAGYSRNRILGYWETVLKQYCRSNLERLEVFLYNGFTTIFRGAEAAKDPKYETSIGVLLHRTKIACAEIKNTQLNGGTVSCWGPSDGS